ncbi:hypothetical protein LXM94_01870 [Rhizobium sp. TRM95111]|uniref:hypothetical protein n=1 Tax=Rhizobium alarense TaxID=2846851 RepID=UPI001F3F940C|nr:hypothetical protein [Rhizobium alarense]MCF3638718.1 hypothetical protein [Rhizobium alarense]
MKFAARSKNENGPASVGALPDLGSIPTPAKDREMNKESNTITSAATPVLTRRSILGGLAMASVPVTGSAALVATETPVQTVDRLANELSHALAGYAGGEMHATVWPAGSGRGVQLTVTHFETEDDKDALLNRAHHHASELTDLMERINPDRAWRYHIDAQASFALVCGDRLEERA